MRHHQTTRGRVRDWLTYIVIAVLFVALFFGLGAYQGMTGGSSQLPLKWMAFAGVSAIVFGYAIRARRRSWSKPKFWLLLIVFAVVHSGVGVFALGRVADVPLLLFSMLTYIEYLLLAAYVDFFMDSD